MSPSPDWKVLSEEEAQQHPLYGVGGWLLVFAAALLLGVLRLLGDVNSLAHEANMTLGEILDLDLPLSSFLKGALFIQTAAAVLIYAMMAMKPSCFRTATTWVLLATFPLIAAWGSLQPLKGVGAIIGQGLVVWVISSVVWITYLHRSRRVRVTFEHTVRTDAAPAEVTTEMNGRLHGAHGATPNCRPPETMPSITSRPIVAQAALAGEEHWSQALAEFEGPERRPGLWARCFFQADGDETKAKVAYLRDRTQELAAQSQSSQGEPTSRESPTGQPLAQSTDASETSQPSRCPNCDTAIPLKANECPSCKPVFGKYAEWKPIPPVRRPLIF